MCAHLFLWVKRYLSKTPLRFSEILTPNPFAIPNRPGFHFEECRDGGGGNQPQPFCQRQFLEHHKLGLELWEVPQSEGGAGAAAAVQENSKGLRITIYSHKMTAFASSKVPS